MRFLFAAIILMVAPSVRCLASDETQSDPVLTEATDLAGAIMFFDSGAPGMVLVVVRGDRSVVLGYGETDKVISVTPMARSFSG